MCMFVCACLCDVCRRDQRKGYKTGMSARVFPPPLPRDSLSAIDIFYSKGSHPTKTVCALPTLSSPFSRALLGNQHVSGLPFSLRQAPSQVLLLGERGRVVGDRLVPARAKMWGGHLPQLPRRVRRCGPTS